MPVTKHKIKHFPQHFKMETVWNRSTVSHNVHVLDIIRYSERLLSKLISDWSLNNNNKVISLSRSRTCNVDIPTVIANWSQICSIRQVSTWTGKRQPIITTLLMSIIQLIAWSYNFFELWNHCRLNLSIEYLHYLLLWIRLIHYNALIIKILKNCPLL